MYMTEESAQAGLRHQQMHRNKLGPRYRMPRWQARMPGLPRCRQLEPQITRNHAELVGLADSDLAVQSMLEISGMAPDAVLQSIDRLINGQAVMLATNQIMTVVGLAFILAALAIWLAPKPGKRVVDASVGGHRSLPEHSTGHIMFKHLLVPTDGTEFSMATVRCAASFASDASARITFLNIEHAFPAMYLGEGAIMDENAPASTSRLIARPTRILERCRRDCTCRWRPTS